MDKLHKDCLHLSFDSIHFRNLFCSYIGPWRKQRSQHGHHADWPCLSWGQPEWPFSSLWKSTNPETIQKIVEPGVSGGFFLIQGAWNQQIMFLFGGFRPPPTKKYQCSLDDFPKFSPGKISKYVETTTVIDHHFSNRPMVRYWMRSPENQTIWFKTVHGMLFHPSFMRKFFQFTQHCSHPSHHW